jgi:hypothetical protein
VLAQNTAAAASPLVGVGRLHCKLLPRRSGRVEGGRQAVPQARAGLRAEGEGRSEGGKLSPRRVRTAGRRGGEVGGFSVRRRSGQWGRGLLVSAHAWSAAGARPLSILGVLPLLGRRD